MAGYYGFKSKAEYEKYYSGSLPQWEMDAMKAYVKEAEAETMAKELTDISAILRHETDNAYLLYDGRSEIKKGDTAPTELRVWVPKSQVEDNGDGTWTMPEWLAIEKGFI